MSLTRKPSHAGSWYTSNGDQLNRELTTWLSQVDTDHSPARAVIVPHAGYTYSGPTAAWGYKQINPAGVKRIFILGPSHHVHIRSGCALTKTNRYSTPIGDLIIDEEMNLRLEESGLFERMSISTDEDEHSIEMQLPYIAKIMEKHAEKFTVVPLLVGATNPGQEEAYGRLLAPYLSDPSHVFVISSDFCHWGKRFRYTYYDKEQGDIYQSIEHLDRMGMKLIEDLNPRKFLEYLDKYSNTICGRHPINILLNAVKVLCGDGVRLELKFLKYAQSSKCYDMRESSVSYATASMVIR